MRNRTGSGGGGVQLLAASYHRRVQSQGLSTVGFRGFVGLFVVSVNLAVGVRPSHAGANNFQFLPIWLLRILGLGPFWNAILLYCSSVVLFWKEALAVLHRHPWGFPSMETWAYYAEIQSHSTVENMPRASHFWPPMDILVLPWAC